MPRIVPQLATLSYCLFPALCAPRIAGLLPARASTPSAPQITVIKPRQSLRERQRAIWAAQDAELENFFQGARQRLTAVYADVVRDYAPRSTRPFIWEMAS